MSPRDFNAPDELPSESTSTFRERAGERIARLEATAASKDWVDETVTGCRRSLETKIAGLPSSDKIDAIMTDVDMLASKESVSALNAGLNSRIDGLGARIDGLGLPKFWQLITLAALIAIFVAGVVWKAHDEVSELDKRAAILEARLEAVQKLLDAQTALTASLTATLAASLGKRVP